MAKRTPDPKRAVAYLRVSTDEQSLGTEAQRHAIEAWAAAHGVTVAAWHADLGVSGGAPVDSRPGLLAALADVSELGAGVLIVSKRDRLARDVLISAMVEQLVSRQGARIVSAAGEGSETNDPSGQLMGAIVNAFAQYERALIRSRTKAALAVKKGRGERTGGVPYGMQLALDGTLLEPNAAEQSVLSQVRAWRAAGLSVRAIVSECERLGLAARNGKPFIRTQIVRMLARAA